MAVDPGALATWANAITVGRLLLSPLMFWVMPDHDRGAWGAFALWFVLCASDAVDGWFARRHGATRSGAFLDPLADKVLILGAMFTLVDRGVFWIVPVAILAIREFVISMYRTVAGSKGVSVPATRIAKYKTLCQQLAVAFALLPWTATAATWLWTGCLWAAVVLAVWSGWQYLHRARAHSPRRPMRCDVLAVGTELLLGQIVDTNSAWIGEQLAANGIVSLTQVKVGDNVARIEAALRRLLDDADAVIVCGGLGPTHDDVTRDAIAAVMGAELRVDEDVADVIRKLFAARGRVMPANNLRQALVPVGAAVIPQTRGTAPGLICPVGERVIYAVPGVPHEMEDMLQRTVLADLRSRDDAAGVIASRVLKTWGESESGLDERLRGVIARLDEVGDATLAFLARGWNGLEFRLTTRQPDAERADAVLARWETEVRELLGPLVFGADGDSMESVVVDRLRDGGLTLGVAESLTGGLVASRLTAVEGVSDVLRGSVVSYASEVKFDVLGVTPGPVVNELTAAEMAEGVRGVLGADVGLSLTGVAGPSEQDGVPVGTVCIGVALPSGIHTTTVRLGRQRDQIRQFAVITALDLLRRRLLAGGDS